MSQEAYIGQVIHYFPNGQRDKQTVPMAGIINRAWDGMVADIAVIPVSSGAVATKDYVPHISDRRLKDHRGAPSELGKQRGAWDFIPAACCQKECCPKECCKADAVVEAPAEEESPSKSQRGRKPAAKK